MPLELLDYPVFRQQIAATSSVTLQQRIVCPVVPNDQLWRVDNVAVGIINFLPFVLDFVTNPPTVALYDLAPGPNVMPLQITQLSNYVAGQNTFWGDWDDQSSPITIRGGDQLTILFNNVLAPIICLARVQYGVYQGVAGKPQPIAGGVPGPQVPVSL